MSNPSSTRQCRSRSDDGNSNPNWRVELQEQYAKADRQAVGSLRDKRMRPCAGLGRYSYRLFERNLLRWFTFYEELAAMVPALLCDSNRNDGDGMTLLQFPADRRTADVRRCAEALQQLHGEAANRFWRSEMAVFATGLREQGVAEDEIGHQAGLFMRAVQMELELVFAAEEALA